MICGYLAFEFEIFGRLIVELLTIKEQDYGSD